jgi:2-polyprenyl-6-hydroxyphenyl methylase/3-demethylubiquinone-9 3-methyltransferase
MTENVDVRPNFDPSEIARFQSAASRWWDPEGEMRPLHDLNPVRLEYVERAGPLAGRSVVDVGCGGGLLAEAMARKGARVVGLDLADDLLRVAQLHALEAGVNLEYRYESAEAHVAAHAGQYDVVTCMEMLEHVPDPSAVVEALARLARPGGHVFVSTLNRTPRAYLMAILGAEYVLRLLPPGTHTYHKFIRPSELTAWARDAGLEEADIAGLDYEPFSRHARLTDDAAVNYLMHFRKPPAGAGVRA